jgi:multidrug efflux pump subunit AcrA (membrane-fusion protein)
MTTRRDGRAARAIRAARVAVLIALSLGAGYLLRGACAPTPEQAAAAPDGGAAEATIWTCSMHPTVRRDAPGLCPICAMDLIPLGASSAGDAPVLSVSTAEAALMQVQTTPVERRFPIAELRMVGKLGYDETQRRFVTAWIPGRIDRLFVDYEGVTVREGDHLADIYSPQLLAAQEELLQARSAIDAMSQSSLEVLRGSAQANFDAASEKLLRWGMNAAQLEELLASGETTDHTTIYARRGGVVTEKLVKEGAYVAEGARIYSVDDLSHLWVRFDAYESDLVWLHYGQRVDFQTEAYPGRHFTGSIAFLSRELDPVTRTVMVRVNVANEDGLLKPGMFVRGEVRARLAADGPMMDPELAGRWICPMHPEIVEDMAGSCDLCGMPLVPIESLGYAPADPEEAQAPLVVPKSAALRTGRRAVVYVQVPDAPTPTFEGREVVLGPRAGDVYIVLEGLREGEIVVTRGNFKIDAARSRAHRRDPRHRREPADRLHRVDGPLAAGRRGPDHLSADGRAAGRAGVKTIRSYSMFGFSTIYVIFEEDVEFYWSRTRVLEKLNSLPAGTLPEGVQPTLGPDATPLGQVFWYTLEGRDPDGQPGRRLGPRRAAHGSRTGTCATRCCRPRGSRGRLGRRLRAGVPDRRRSRRHARRGVGSTTSSWPCASNVDVGARTIEINKAEYFIRGLGFVESVEDIEDSVVAVNDNVPIYVKDVATSPWVPRLRRGALDKGGARPWAGGRRPLRLQPAGGDQERQVADRRDCAGAADQGGRRLPASDARRSRGLSPRANNFDAFGCRSSTTTPGSSTCVRRPREEWPAWVTTSQVTVVPFYDRTGLIYETLGTLNKALVEQILVTIIVILVMVMHLRSSILISALLPLAVLMCFIAMKTFGVDANIVALSGIAIAIGTMVDMGIILCENILKHLDEADPGGEPLGGDLRASSEVGSAC